MILFAFLQGVHFDGTITLGSLLTALTFLLAAGVAWTDIRWRIKNLEDWKDATEEWKKNHKEDSDKRDELIHKLDLANTHLSTLVTSQMQGGRRFTDPT